METKVKLLRTARTFAWIGMGAGLGALLLSLVANSSWGVGWVSFCVIWLGIVLTFLTKKVSTNGSDKQ
ncbi:hypothetical protein [Shewanella glacialipiscicola]|uniref:hypothetical protein n=1 Tax=Shewanella glacialipiscicola TaxID=614069 RepID=UPI003D79F42E